MAGHAILSPSGFKALMLCPAKPAMERGLPDKSSDYADEGTAAHFLGSECLLSGMDTKDFLGDEIVVHSGGADWYSPDIAGKRFTVDQDMADYVQRGYIDVVRGRMEMYRKLSAQVELHVEQALPISHITGEEGAEGTGDAIIIAHFVDGRTQVDVIDLKYGRGVEVSAEDNGQPNPQLALYALGAIEKFGMVYDFNMAGMVICQPRITDTPSEFTMAVSELQQWAEDVAKPAAIKAWGISRAVSEGAAVSPEDCRPHEDACRFCKAKPTCPALARRVEEALGAEFTDLTTSDATEQDAIVKSLVPAANGLGAKLDAVPLVEMWCKAIRAQADSVMLAGGEVGGYKLVAGRKGARAWSDTQAAEKMLKSFRLKNSEMYDFTVISPTTAEKKLGKQPKRWEKLVALITQGDGKPSVAPVSDKRPALSIRPVAEEFTPIQDEPQGAEDLV